MSKTINTNQLTPGSVFMVRGNLTFTRITSMIEGDELQKDIARRRQRGQMNPPTRPYTTATICNAQVVYADPNNKTIEERFAEESLYKSTSQTATGWCFSAMNKGKNLPWVALPEANGTLRQVAITDELAAGMDVTLVMRVFATDKANNGTSLDGIICNEPIRYYVSNNINAGLSRYGMSYMPDPSLNTHTAAPAPIPEMAPMNAPVSYPAGNAFTNQPQAPVMPPQNPMYGDNNGYGQQPATYAGPAPAVPMNAPMSAPMNAPMTAPAAPPFGQQPQGGIRYNPDDRQY